MRRGAAALRWMMLTRDILAKGKGAAVLNHKPIKVLRLSQTCRVCIRSWLLAKDSEVRRKYLQLWRTYHRRRTLRKMKTAGKATGNHPGKYVMVRL